MELTHFRETQSTPIKDFIAIAEKLAMTNYFIDEDGILDPKVLVARGFAKIMMGHELGLSPMFAMQHVNIIKGKMTLDAGGVAALIAGSPKYDYKFLSHTDKECELQFLKNDEILGTVKWTIDDAKQAGLVKEKSVWTKYPKDMLFARAITAGARRHTPDIFGGSICTPEELETSYTVEESFTDEERKKFHMLGSLIYADDWDDKRHELVNYITNGRTSSSSEISRSEMVRLITGMEKKQRESIPETGFENPS